jgi:outer membrane protein assembly factor BamA
MPPSREKRKRCPGHPSVTVFLFFLLVVRCEARANESPIVRTAIRSIGSVPPGDSLFRCATELNGKRYSDAAIHACVKSLDELSFVQRVKVHKSGLEDGRILVEFEMSAKPLPIREMTFDCTEGEKSELEAWLKTSPGALRLGAPFSRDEETVTYQAIKSFYLSRGRLVGIVPTVDLRFREGAASVSFRIVYGPEVRSEPQLPPHSPHCSDAITGEDWSNTDKYVPFALVHSAVSLSAPLACYSTEAAHRDRSALNGLGILESSEVEYTGHPGNRRISYKLKGRPTTLADVSIHTYGFADSCLVAARQSLQLKAGETYLRQNADQSAASIEQSCSGPGIWTEVTEADRLTADGRLEVVFNVLTFPLQTVLIDGVAVGSAQQAGG